MYSGWNLWMFDKTLEVGPNPTNQPYSTLTQFQSFDKFFKLHLDLKNLDHHNPPQNFDVFPNHNHYHIDL